MEGNPAVVEAAEDAGLRYVSDSAPGITRHRSGKGFIYRDSHGDRVADPKVLDRINSLAIPPAYERVWICADPKGHLQATGIDARGRKQYRYHDRFREVRDENKFMRLPAFGQHLSRLRKQADRDLRRQGLPKEKVLAVVIGLLERSLIRVGNEEYAKANGSFGLTTMRNWHVNVAGSTISFNFMGKSKVKHRIEVDDPRLARVIKRVQDLPGQELFQYLDEDGTPCSITSADVNEYLKTATGEDFTAKDFRTWWGTLLAMVEFAGQDTPATKTEAKRTITAVMTAVSKQLGNTPSVCRKCYVHPLVVGAYEQGKLPSLSSYKGDGEVAYAERALRKLLTAGSRRARLKAA